VDVSVHDEQQSDTEKQESVSPPVPVHSRRDIRMALTGTLFGLVLAALASTTILTSLPIMMSDLGAGQSAYTWVVSATLLTTTVSLAIWGKLADLFSHKNLMFGAIAIFVAASLFAGLSPNAEVLIGFRALQGVGAGGLIAVGPVLLADLLSPRDRGRYAGLISGVIGVGTMGGPVIGGIITDSVGWRWNFYLGIPFAIAAVLLLQKSLHLPVHSRTARIDWLGATLIAGGASLLMLWVTMAGHQFPWGSWISISMAVGSLAFAVAVVLVERKVEEPVIPLSLLMDASISRVVIASTALGVTMLAVPTFMSQYFQIARGLSASMSGTFMLSMSLATFLAASIVGQVISRTGHWKLWVITGSVFLVLGLAGLATLNISTSLVAVSAYLVAIGFAIGVLMQNLLIVSQNCAPADQLGAATALPAFFRQLASAISVSILGAVLMARISTFQASRVHSSGGSEAASGVSVPRISELDEPLRGLVQEQYADIIGDLFLLCVPLAVVGLLATLALPNIPLRTKTAVQERDLGASVESST
jgi:MFS family permease